MEIIQILNLKIFMKNKQKELKIIGFSFVLVCLLIIAIPVSAANFSVSDKYVSVKRGDVIEVVVNMNSYDIDSYTFKSSIAFPADLLSVSDWQWGSNLIPIEKDGYDLIDNTSGKIIKTAGYPTGLSGEKEFGVITFVAKKNGNGVILFNDNESLILDEQSENIYF